VVHRCSCIVLHTGTAFGTQVLLVQGTIASTCSNLLYLAAGRWR
jgi:hypothetical protein